MSELQCKQSTLDKYLTDVNAYLSNREDHQHSENRIRFTSKDNIRIIISSIINAIKTKMDIQLELNNLPPHELATIMRSIYLQHGTNNTNKIDQDTFLLNKKVSASCIRIIMSAITHAKWTTNNVDENGYPKPPTDLIDMPSSNYTSNQLHNPLVADDSHNIFDSSSLSIFDQETPLTKLQMPFPGGNRARPDEPSAHFENILYSPPQYDKHKLWKIK